MTIAVDIGNSNIVLGIHQDDNWKHIIRFETKVDYSVEAYINLIRVEFGRQEVKDVLGSKVVISSVVPRLGAVFVYVMRMLTGGTPILLSSDIYSRLPVLVTNPGEIGTDLVANALAAWDLFRGNVIVVDFGTALSITTVSDAAQIIGVAIAPGLQTAVDSLFNRTAQLPEVTLTAPDSVLGQNTIHSINAGIVYGYKGMVEELVARTKAEINGPASVVATGGMLHIIAPLTKIFDHTDPNLTLEGLRMVGRYV